MAWPPTKYGLVCTDTQAHPEARSNASLNKDARWQNGLVWQPDLDQGKGDQQDKGNNEQSNNAPIVPLRLAC